MYRKIRTGNSLIVIAPTNRFPSACASASLLTPSDREHLSGTGSEARRRAGIAWRSIVRGEGESSDIVYDDTGAPRLTSPVKWSHIGISHSRCHAAVIFSSLPCAIDIESTARNFARISSRYISHEESALPASDHPLFMAALWCAKETLYKASRRRALDLTADMRIVHADLGLLSDTTPKHALTGTVLDAQGIRQTYPLFAVLHEEDIVVFTER
jgi:phosphopantetheinyl transferase (holo-ACP synthase)